METRHYEIKDCNMISSGSVALTGKESANSTVFVTEYGKYEDFPPYEKVSYGTITPDEAFCNGMISAEDAMTAESHSLFVLTKMVQADIDERAVREFVGYIVDRF